MRLLIVDDMQGVLDGLSGGIDWAAEGFEDVQVARNAMEARAVIRQEPVDIMLCDIEMPVESGLQLYEWIVAEKYETLCIFLTSHAEFEYAKRAVRLGAFEYIVQPATYREIVEVVRRGLESLRARRDKEQYYDKGQIYQQHENTIAANALRSYLSGTHTAREMEEAAPPGSIPPLDATGHLILIQILRWHTVSDRLEEGLMVVALDNIVKEIFKVASPYATAVRMGDDIYALIIGVEDPAKMGMEMVKKTLLYLNSVCEQYLYCTIACYLSGLVPLDELPKHWKKLQQNMANNVALKQGVFHQLDTAQGDYHYHTHQIKQWANHLQAGYAETMEDEVSRYLDEVARDEKFDSTALFFSTRTFCRCCTRWCRVKTTCCVICLATLNRWSCTAMA